MKKMFMLFVTSLLYITMMADISNAQTSGFSIKNRFGVGILTSAVNFGIGPAVEFWPSENIGILGYFTSLFDYTTYGGRLDFMFSQPFYLGTSPNKVYFGGGYLFVQGPETSGGIYDLSWKVEQEGNGAEIHAGVLHQANWAIDRLFFRGEFIYYAFDLDTKGSSNFGYESSVDTDWNSFTIGLGIHYLF